MYKGQDREQQCVTIAELQRYIPSYSSHPIDLPMCYYLLTCTYLPTYLCYLLTISYNLPTSSTYAHNKYLVHTYQPFYPMHVFKNDPQFQKENKIHEELQGTRMQQRSCNNHVSTNCYIYIYIQLFYFLFCTCNHLTTKEKLT